MKSLRPGVVLGNQFRLESRLGAGGMGVVWRAYQFRLDREVAIKTLQSGFGLDDKSRTRFQREALSASALHHPNAIKIFDFGEDEGVVYIAMELLRGMSLGELVRTMGPLPVSRVLAILTQVSSVLVSAHEARLLHRDIKLDNIFIEPKIGGGDRAVVLDFGLAYLEQRDYVSRLTREGSIVGTPIYLAPEAAVGELSEAADLYALGIVAYECLTGHPPFDGSLAQLMSKHAFELPRALSEHRADIPAEVESLIAELLAKEPSRRPDATELYERLRSMKPGASLRAKRREGLEGRAARMISTVPRKPSGPMTEPEGLELSIEVTEPKGETLTLAHSAPLDSDTAITLELNRVKTVFVPADALSTADADVIWAPSIDPEWLARVEVSIPIVSDVSVDDVDRIAALLRVGVADVITRPVSGDELARKAWRACRKARRKLNRTRQ